MVVTAASWTETARGVAAVVQILAIVVAGAWAYYKFVRGRTFKPRAELDLNAHILEVEDEKAISLNVDFHNTGSIRIEFPRDDDPGRLLQVEVRGTDATTPGANPYWGDELILADVFARQDGCEVGETLRDHLLLPVPIACEPGHTPWRAFQIEAVVVSPKRRGPTGRPRPWRATPAPSEPTR